MADFLISDLGAIGAAIADNTSFEAQRSGQTTTEKYVGTDLKTYLRWAPRHFGYVAGNWYVPAETFPLVSGSAAGGIDSMRFFPFFVEETCTLSDVQVRVGTNVASQNIQVAVYASDSTTKKPTGNALASTGNISTASTGNVTGAFSVAVQLTRGVLYWMATNASHAGIILVSISSNDAFASRVLGTSTAGNIIGSSGVCLSGLSAAQTFGTWPDVTLTSFSDIVSSTLPFVAFKVSAVP